MKLKSINVTNYRGFDHIEFEFGDITVLAGENGSGKSSFLEAIRSACSRIYREAYDHNEAAITFNYEDVKLGANALSVSATFDHENARAFGIQIAREAISPEQVAEFKVEIEEIRKNRRYEKKDSPKDREMEQRLIFLGDRIKNSEDHVSSQPEFSEAKAFFGNRLFCYYSPNRNFLKLTQRPSASQVNLGSTLGHLGALSGEGISLNGLLRWFLVAQTGSLGDGYASKGHLDDLNQVIREVLPGFGKVALEEVEGRKLPRFTVEKSGERFDFFQLSDGEKTLLALALDIFRRLTLANPDSTSPIDEGVATILIDEVEQHLHPTWQRRILRRLRKAFPKCQFIVTTHSPQVIGQTKPENLRLLHRDENGKLIYTIPSQSKGMDSSWILQHIMGTAARDVETEQKLSAIFDFIEGGKLPEARSACDVLEAEVGSFPELQEASSLLDRLELLAADEEGN